jgi:2-C-methyl-D-erythritol 4-phosphate cytidylyltransferase
VTSTVTHGDSGPIPDERLGVVIPAAGSGLRMGGVRKPFLEVGGRPLLEWVLKAFLSYRSTVSVIVALPERDVDEAPDWLSQIDGRVRLVAGGATRTESVRAGLAALPADVTVVAVQDGARPVVDTRALDECLAVCRGGAGAVVGYPASDTIKEVDADGRVVRTPDRSTLWQVQTPQVFPKEMILRAYDVAAAEGRGATDDAQLVESAGGVVFVVEGSRANVKVTYPRDVKLAEWALGVQFAGGRR